MTCPIDLNADLGEGCPWDAKLLEQVSSASVCCGFHAGDPAGIAATLRAAKAQGVVVGAHPGYADRDGFGRREQSVDASRAEAIVREQVTALAALASSEGVPIRFLKPHGALYNQAQREPEAAAGIVAAAGALGLPILGQPGGLVEVEAARRGVRFLAEGFADRRYRPDGRLVPRTEPGALLTDPAEIAAQVRTLVRLGIETLCLHGDSPGAVALAGIVLEALAADGVAVEPFA